MAARLAPGAPPVAGPIAPRCQALASCARFPPLALSARRRRCPTSCSTAARRAGWRALARAPRSSTLSSEQAAARAVPPPPKTHTHTHNTRSLAATPPALLAVCATQGLHATGTMHRPPAVAVRWPVACSPACLRTLLAALPCSLPLRAGGCACGADPTPAYLAWTPCARAGRRLSVTPRSGATCPAARRSQCCQSFRRWRHRPSPG